MKWLELQIKTTAENEDVVSGILYNHGATGLAIEDPNDIIEFSKTEGDWDFIDSDLVDIDTDKDIDIKNHNKNNKAGTPEGLKGPPAPRPGTPGYEWVRDGIRYRITENSEVEELGPV